MSDDTVLEGAETVVHQTGVVVKDLDKTVEFLTARESAARRSSGPS